jgi:PKD repeat protein
MIENYMDYTPDDCMNIFTLDQKERMRTVMQVSPRRKELLQSDVHLASDRPIARFSTDKTEVCAGEVIQFTDNSTNSPTGWTWTFYDPNGAELATFSDQNPTLIFNGIGVYGVELVVTNTSGRDTIFEPNFISVLSSETQVLPYTEDFEGDVVLSNWVLYNPDGDRTWDLSNQVSSSGGTWAAYMDNFSDIDGDPTGKFDALFSSQLDLAANPDAYLEFDVAYAAYGGEYSDTLVVYATTDCGETVEIIWFKGGTDLATAANTQEPFVPGEEQWVRERISLTSLNGSDNVHLAIVNWSGWGNNLYIDNLAMVTPSYDEPTTSLFWTPFDTVTVGSTVGFADYSGNFPTQWLWNFDGGSPASSMEQNVYVTYNALGTYDVSLTTSNASGGDTYDCTGCITIVDKPSISSSSNRENNTICSGDSIAFTAEGGLYYQWYDERGYLISQEQTLQVLPTRSTSFEVVGYDRYGGTNTSTENVTVNELPAVDLGPDLTLDEGETVTLDAGQDFAGYLWSDNSTGSTLEFVANDYGVGAHEIWVMVTDENGCQSTNTVTVTVEQSTGIIHLPHSSSTIKVFPNPTGGPIHIEIRNLTGEFHCDVIDTNGQVLKSVVIHQDLELIDLSDLPAGFYNLRFYNVDFNRSMTIVKMK